MILRLVMCCAFFCFSVSADEKDKDKKKVAPAPPATDRQIFVKAIDDMLTVLRKSDDEYAKEIKVQYKALKYKKKDQVALLGSDIRTWRRLDVARHGAELARIMEIKAANLGFWAKPFEVLGEPAWEFWLNHPTDRRYRVTVHLRQWDFPPSAGGTDASEEERKCMINILELWKQNVLKPTTQPPKPQ